MYINMYYIYLFTTEKDACSYYYFKYLHFIPPHLKTAFAEFLSFKPGLNM